MKLKTLKDMESVQRDFPSNEYTDYGDGETEVICKEELKQELIKWIKTLKSKDFLLFQNKKIVKCLVDIANKPYNAFTVKEFVALHFKKFGDITEEELK